MKLMMMMMMMMILLLLLLLLIIIIIIIISSGLQTQRSRVRFPALPDFLRSSGSGTRSTQPREDN
jgi:hypothetical protein